MFFCSECGYRRRSIICKRSRIVVVLDIFACSLPLSLSLAFASALVLLVGKTSVRMSSILVCLHKSYYNLIVAVCRSTKSCWHEYSFSCFTVLGILTYYIERWSERSIISSVSIVFDLKEMST